MAPFLSIVTRCYRRPGMLATQERSLEVQTCQDYEHVYLEDHVGRGLHWANQSLANARPRGEYVMVLDDDDLLCDPDAIAKMKRATKDRPALVIFRAEHDFLGLLPTPKVWGKRPVRGHIGSCDFITRRDWWEKHIKAFGAPVAGDFAFLDAMWQQEPSVVWLDDTLASVQRVSSGRPE